MNSFVIETKHNSVPAVVIVGTDIIKTFLQGTAAQMFERVPESGNCQMPVARSGQK